MTREVFPEIAKSEASRAKPSAALHVRWERAGKKNLAFSLMIPIVERQASRAARSDRLELFAAFR